MALDWTSFARDGHEKIVLSMLTGHGRATPLMWRTVPASMLKGNQRRYEYELLRALREAMPAGVNVTVIADRGLGMLAMRIRQPKRRDRMLLLSALSIALLTLFGTAGESLGCDR